MKTLLLTPPHTNPVGPTLGIAVLSAHLREKFPDCEFKAIDQGLDAIYWLLSETTIEKAIERLKHQIVLYESKSSLVFSEGQHYSKCIGALCVLSEFKDEISDSILALKKEETYQDDKIRNRANFIINQVLEQLAVAWLGTLLNAGDYRTHLSPFSIKDIEYYVEHPSESIFNDFFDAWIDNNDLTEIDMLGLSISFAKQVLPAFLFASKVRKKYPNIHIVIGGSMMAHWNQNYFLPLFKWCECIIQREGEFPLENLVRAYQNNLPLSEEFGVLFVNENGVLSGCQKQPRVDLEKEPTPDFSGFRLKDYITPSANIPLQIGRSCYWGNCTFCCLNTAFEHKNCWTNVQKLVHDIEYLVKTQDIKTVEFVDDAIPPVFARSLSEELIKRDVHIKWFCYARFDKGFSSELFKLMYEAGCVGLKFGLESASPRVSKLMNKGIDIEYAGKLVDMASKAGIIPQAAFFYGFPGEEKEDIWMTAKFIEDNVIGRGIIAYNGIFRLLKSMPLIDEAEKYGIRKIEKWNSDEELIDYYTVTMEKDNSLAEEIRNAEAYLSKIIDLDLTRSVDLRRYWFAGYGNSNMDEMADLHYESKFPLDQIKYTQDMKNGDFLPGKGIYETKSYISPGLHCEEIKNAMDYLYPRINEQSPKMYKYNIRQKKFITE